jgi:HD-GYP domain-containing protein (c-di-GMP phosphodiesterase class II)
MIIDITELLFALSYALDSVEHSLLGVHTNHGKRVSRIAATIGKDAYGLNGKELMELSACAIMHDNALTEYIASELNFVPEIVTDGQKAGFGKHCEIGEKNFRLLPFDDSLNGVILYHHENSDGSGPFHLKEAEIPLFSQLIHFADVIDANFFLGDMNAKKQDQVVAFLKENASWFNPRIVSTFLERYPLYDFDRLSDSRIDDSLREIIPDETLDLTGRQLDNVAGLFAQIVDYDSHFTFTHSRGIARKAREMGEYYGEDERECEKLFLAGALHDIGKLTVSTALLDKPGRLTSEEFEAIKKHAYQTWYILHRIRGFSEITFMACRHHEKLDGSGYPFGIRGEQLTRSERLMCCVDIYQALTEDRPYRKGMQHDDAMKIMREMADSGTIDRTITDDIDRRFRGN